MAVRKAVIPAAGLGTRFLPATKSQPKEMLPVVDRPGIQYVVEEAVRSGLDDILVITSRGKATLEDHFDRSLELEHHLERTGKTDLLAEVRKIAEMANFHYIRQKEPLGFGHAVLLAKEHVGDEPFVVMVGDEIVPEPRGDEPPLVERMNEIYEAKKASVIAVQEVAKEDIPGYGIIDPESQGADPVKLKGMVEKPAIEDAPSNLASRGRYVFTPQIFEAIERTSKGVGGEIQLTDAIRLLAQEQGVYAYIHPGPILDVGKKLDYLKATVELALRRDDLGEPFRAWLMERTADLGESF
ncbi:MAG TPA: UTP--glucose-1-phosphate uridylyltransferase GalU [Actinomycetota bacterium]|nr:UTP--glucose-1-phosphate uridylyltransferase GalU [Actinomycetota bacterium]